MSHRLVARTLFVAATAAAMTGTPVLPAAAAARGTEVFVEVTPNTVQAGDQVRIQASCDGNDRQARVRPRPRTQGRARSGRTS